MSNVSLWSSVAVAVQSALATACTITGITKANPGVVTYTGTDPANGDYIVVSAQGMADLDGRVFRAANVNAGANTLELEGENTTNYGTFSTGSFQVITFGTNFSTATGLSASGGEFDMIDVTTISDPVKKQIPGVASPAVYTFESLWDPADAGLAALKAVSDVKGQRAVRITFANGQKALFTGYVGTTLLPRGSAQDKVMTSVVITMFGRPTYYTT